MYIRILSKLLILTICLSGCTNPFTEKDPRANADKIAYKNNFTKETIQTDTFLLTTYKKLYPENIHERNTETNRNKKTSTQTINIYIEGDGHSWINRTTLSSDPTPHNPLALKLAVIDPAPNVVYLARPCQYTVHALDRHCHHSIWSQSRFSEKVIYAMNQAVDSIKKSSGAKNIQLVGFSGGAAVAILIAARRQDIVKLITVAGDLDHTAMSEFHHTTPLSDSLNPKMTAKQILHIPQTHLIGTEDKTVPTFISENYVNALTAMGATQISRHVLKDFTHHQGWEKNWLSLLQLSKTHTEHEAQ